MKLTRLFIFVTFALCSVSSVAAPPLPFAIIDAHTHTVGGFSSEKRALPPAKIIPTYLGALKEANVEQAIAHSYELETARIDLRKKGVTHCSGIRETTDMSKLEAGLKDGRFRCIKVYLGYVHKFANDPVYRRAYKLADKYGVPVVFHTGDTIDKKAKLKFADPLTIDEVAVDFPKVNFVIAHCGNPWIQSAAEVAYKNPNVFLEVSAFLTGNMDELPPEQIEKYVLEPIRWIFGYVESPDKIIFGSDYPLSNIAAYARAVSKAIPKEHWQAVFHDNAARVFKLKARQQ